VDDTFHLGQDGIYRCQAFQQHIWQSHGFGTRQHNPTARITLRQIHSDIVFNAHGLRDREKEGDALVTNDMDLSIGVRSADCVPILLLDTATRAVGAVHAGWRGTAARVVQRAIHKMASDFSSKPSDILAAIGPCVRPCCYEVGQEVLEQFEELFPEWQNAAPKPNGNRDLNLAEANIRQMKAVAIPADQIMDSCLCTCCQIETFYSYRREPGETGRMTSAIARLS
jgi:YfiH family protein